MYIDHLIFESDDSSLLHSYLSLISMLSSNNNNNNNNYYCYKLNKLLKISFIYKQF